MILNVEKNDLSTDQLYLLNISTAVSTGSCSPDLARRNPGLMNHSRWLTTDSRLLRLYIATDNPSENLIAIVTFIQRVYAPMWFQIKLHPSCKDGARHLFLTIEKSRYLSAPLKQIVYPVIQRNVFFAHPENIMLSMLTDERRVILCIRKLCIRRIIKTRKEPSRGVRRFTEL